MRRLAPLTALLLLAAWSPTPAAPAQDTTNAANVAQRLDAVRGEIRALAAEQRKAGSARDDLTARLAAQADALAAAAKAVAASQQDLATHQQQLADLESQRQTLTTRLAAQRGALGDLLRAAYTLGHGSDLRILLGQLGGCADASQCRDGDDSLARISRALAYSRYFQRDRVARIRAIAADVTNLDAIRARIASEQDALAKVLAAQREHATALEAQRAAQQKLIAAAEAEIKVRGDRLQTLGNQEKSLQALLAKLRDVFADIPRTLGHAAPFSKQRGQLPWPLQGAAQPDNHGLLIAASPGTPVHAVAYGRIAYAAWLRGYGMLVILDHGDGWMSLYGGNESLRGSVGDWVEAGDVIATSGRSETGAAGLYFGLRHAGQSVDPKPWLRRR